MNQEYLRRQRIAHLRRLLQAEGGLGAPATDAGTDEQPPCTALARALAWLLGPRLRWRWR